MIPAGRRILAASPLARFVVALAPVLAVGLALALVGCRQDAPPAADEIGDEIPPAAPVGVNEITALQPAGARVWVATSSGVVTFVPGTGAWSLFADGDGVSHERARALAVDAGGTAWTAHAGALPGEEAQPGLRRGGVRAFRPDGTVGAYFQTEGLPSDDAWSIAAGDDFVAASSRETLALLRSGSERFETVEAPAKRKLTLVDPSAGGATRSLTEFRRKDETITALAAAGTRLWIGTNHGLLAREGDALFRVLLPACRRDGSAPDAVVALGLRPDGIVASVALERESGSEPSGAVEILAMGTARICHVPGVDVPGVLTPGVASDGRTTWLATYEGLVRIRGADVLLFERGRELPSLPPTAVATDGEGGAWVGFWGGGVAHVRERDVTLWRFGAGPAGVAAPERRPLE